MKKIFSLAVSCLIVLVLMSIGCKKSTTEAPRITIPVVTTIAGSNITSSSFQSGGTVTSDGGSAITGRGVCWSTSTNPVFNNNHSNDGTGSGVFTSSISGLALNTTYYVRAYANNSAGIGYGNTVSFTTGGIAIPTVTTNPVQFIVNTSAFSGGTIISDGGSSIISDGVCMSTSAHPTTSDIIMTGAHTGNGFVCSLTGLSAFTTYYIRAFATNSVGTGYGNELSFATTYTEGYQYGGGIIFYVDNTGQHGLIAALNDQSTNTAWWNGAYVSTNAWSATDGAANTIAIINAQGNSGSYAAKICRDYRGGGFTDWFLPANNQLETLYSKRFIAGGFYNAGYWSSTESSAYSLLQAWQRSFSNGVLGINDYKIQVHRVRAIRVF